MSNLVDLSYDEYVAQSELAANDRYRNYDRYFDGQQLIELPAKIKDELATLGVIRNLCALVVNTYVSKLNLKSIISEGSPDKIKTLMQKNHVQLLSTQLHRTTAKYGDGYLRLWPDKERLVSFQRLIPENVRPVYYQDGSQKMKWCKVEWLECDTPEPDFTLSSLTFSRRKDVYYPDHVDRFVMSGVEGDGSGGNGGWAPYSDDDGGSTVTYDFDGHIPIVHFKNRPDESDFGNSELLPAIPIQMDRDRAELGLMLKAEFAAGGQVWMTGFNALEFEANWRAQHPHEPVPALSRDPWTIWQFAGEDVKLGRLAPEALQDFIALGEKIANDMSMCTMTPLAYLRGQAVPSGAAAREIAGPLIDKVKEGQTVLGEAWEDTFNLALTMLKATPDAQIAWEDPFQEDTTDKDLKQLSAGVMSRETFLKNRGYTDEQVVAELAKIDEQKQKQLEMSMEAMGGGVVPPKKPGVPNAKQAPQPAK